MTLRFLITLIAIWFATFTSFTNASAEEITGVSVSPINESALDSQNSSSEVLFVYDPLAVADATPLEISTQDLKTISEAMRSEDYKTLLRDRVVIPMSSEDKEALTKLNDLSAAEIKNFLSRKTKYIEKIAKTLALFSMQPQAINKVITLLNNQLFKNAKLVARANATAATIGIGISGGIGFSDWLATQLRKAPMLKNLPKSSGFYFQLSVGLCVMQTQKFGKTKLAFQPVFEFRRAEKILAAFVGIGVGGGFSLSIEAPNPDDVQTARFFKFSSYNVTSSDTTLSIGLGTGIGLGLTKFAVMEGKATAFRADREGLKLLMNYLGNSFFSRANKCSDVFSMSLLSSRLPSPLDWSY